MPSSFSVGLEVAEDEPVTFVAVTIASSVSPTSIPSRVSVAPVAPLMLVQVPSRHSCHWYLKDIGVVPVQLPLLTLSALPISSRPEIAGRAVFRGAVPEIGELTGLVAVVEPATLLAFTTTSTLSPTYGTRRLSTDAVASEMFLQDSPGGHSCHW